MNTQIWQIALVLVGTLSTLLTGFAAYFLKSIHGDFKKLTERVTVVERQMAVVQYRLDTMDRRQSPLSSGRD